MLAPNVKAISASPLLNASNRHRNQTVSDISSLYIQDPAAFVASSVFGTYRTRKQFNDIRTYTKQYWRAESYAS